MDCRFFDGQVVRLEKIKDVADKFVLVRLTRIDTQDLNLFEFDYDLTMMIFFLNAEEKVYARYCGRGPEGPDARQSLEGLRYTMQSVLAMHEKAEKQFAPRIAGSPRFIRDVQASVGGGRRGGCVHCHQVRETLNVELKKKGGWTADSPWRYPLPENLGMELEVHRGNVVKKVRDKDTRFISVKGGADEADPASVKDGTTPAAGIGLKAGDTLRALNGIPVHSFADVQFALDKSPRNGVVDIAWERGGEKMSAKLPLPEGWRRSSLLWRPSAQNLVPSARLSGTDLDAAERVKLGLSTKQLAFRQKETVGTAAKEAGIKGGDIIVGIDGKEPEMDMLAFNRFVQTNYLVGEKVRILILRDGKREEKEMTLRR